MFKKFTVTMATAAMVAASAMTAMAATSTYFYVYENGTFQAARMGQDCVKSVSVDDNEVTMKLQSGEYTLGTTTFTGKITNAWIDQNENGVYDSGDEEIFSDDVITYDQSDLAVAVDGTDYANFYIQVSIYNGSSETPLMVKTQNTYVPMQ